MPTCVSRRERKGIEIQLAIVPASYNVSVSSSLNISKSFNVSAALNHGARYPVTSIYDILLSPTKKKKVTCPI